MASVFINYRRSDTAQSSAALYAQLAARLGPKHVFFDSSAIMPGAPWPARLASALGESKVMLSIIGPRWLTSANEHGQRRIDEAGDWVASEIVHALEIPIPIIPLFVAGAKELPPTQELPDRLRGLLNHKALKLRDESWDRDLDALISLLGSVHGLIENQSAERLPQPRVKIPALTADELEFALATLPGWESALSFVPEDYPKPRQELKKLYRFKSFKSAVQFMHDAVPRINQLNHHPRWENQWRTLTVYLSTWDIGNRISEVDVELAKELDSLYDGLSE
ncbi:MAG: pterin-4a-carbinolamine dehydratase [Planctomycetota bacterium]|jgi:pterin-4a-carbinolamine dehydratase